MKGPDLFADYDYRPYVLLSDETHPFSDEEGAVCRGHEDRSFGVTALTDVDFA